MTRTKQLVAFLVQLVTQVLALPPDLLPDNVRHVVELVGAILTVLAVGHFPNKPLRRAPMLPRDVAPPAPPAA